MHSCVGCVYDETDTNLCLPKAIDTLQKHDVLSKCSDMMSNAKPCFYAAPNAEGGDQHCATSFQCHSSCAEALKSAINDLNCCARAIPSAMAYLKSNLPRSYFPSEVSGTVAQQTNPPSSST